MLVFGAFRYHEVLIILANLNALTAFFDAIMFHINEPNVPLTLPCSMFYCFIGLPPMLFSIKSVRDREIPKQARFLLTLASPFLLMVSSLPALSNQPYARSVLLGISVSLISFVIRWVLNHSELSGTSDKTNAKNKHSHDANGDIGMEYLMATFIGMSVRWVFVSTNVFYEKYEISTCLFLFAITSTLYAYNGNHTAHVSTHAGHKPTHDKHCGMSMKDYAQTLLTSCAVGANILMCMWVFSSPHVLCRWCEKPVETYGINIILFFASGILLSTLDLLDVSNKATRGYIYAGITLIPISINVFIFGDFSDDLKFTGVCLLILFLPVCTRALFQDLEKVIRKASVTNHKLWVFYAVLFVLLSFFALHFALILYVKPMFTSMFLGKMNVIFGATTALFACSLLLTFELNLADRKESISISKGAVSTYGYLKEKLTTYNERTGYISLIFYVLPCLLALNVSSIEVSNDPNILKVLTWNVYMGHDFWGRDSLPCVGEIIKTLNPDVVALQETDPMFLYQGGKDLFGFLKSYLHHEYSTAPGVKTLEASLGLGLLARHNIKRRYASVFPRDPSLDMPFYSFADASIDISKKYKGPGELHAFSLHAIYKNWTVPPMSKLSKSHMKFITDRIEALPKTTPALVMGDFNLNPNEEELDFFFDEKFGFKNSLCPNRELELPSTMVNEYGIVDHIFYRGLKLIQSKILFEADFISDHRPVYAEFEIIT